MKKFLTSALFILAIVFALFLIIWALPTTTVPYSDNDTSIADSKFFESFENSINYTSSEPSNNDEPLLFDACIAIIKSGEYKQIFEEQRHIGGYSVPVKTVTYFGYNFINIIENEMHNVSTEILVNKAGAYYFNENFTEATLMPADTVTIQSFPYKNLTFVERGTTTLGINDYIYERYLSKDGETIDYLFIGQDIKKMKRYTDINADEYTVYTLELSTDISNARTSLPYGITINKLN